MAESDTRVRILSGALPFVLMISWTRMTLPFLSTPLRASDIFAGCHLSSLRRRVG